MALGDLEREVMTQLWAASGPLTVRQVHERLSANRDLAYTTVMTVLDRLAKKEVVTRQKADRAYLYAPAQSREEMTAAVMLDALTTSGDQDAALAYFVGQLPPQALAAAIEAAKGGGAVSGPRGESAIEAAKGGGAVSGPRGESAIEAAEGRSRKR
jgi:predicted transcriptional regulator